MWWFPAFQDREALIEDEAHEAHEASWLLQKAIAKLFVEGSMVARSACCFMKDVENKFATQ